MIRPINNQIDKYTFPKDFITYNHNRFTVLYMVACSSRGSSVFLTGRLLSFEFARAISNFVSHYRCPCSTIFDL